MKLRCIMLVVVGLVIGALLMGLVSDKHEPAKTEEMVSHAVETSQKVDPDGLADFMMGEEVYTLIDVRREMEHYYGYIPGSVMLPRGVLEFNIENKEFWENEGIYMPAKEEIVVVYCKKGNRGALAAHTLQQMGFKKVFYLEGGFKNWELNYPDYVEKNLEALGGQHEEEDVGAC